MEMKFSRKIIFPCQGASSGALQARHIAVCDDIEFSSRENFSANTDCRN
jgi:uncharacterized metal-binding protein